MSAVEWLTGDAVDHTGEYAFTHLIRSPDDPERGDTRLLPEALRDRSAKWRRELAKIKPAQWKEPILELLSDGKPRTFNRIGVELLDKTADTLFLLPPDVAL